MCKLRPRQASRSHLNIPVKTENFPKPKTFQILNRRDFRPRVLLSTSCNAERTHKRESLGKALTANLMRGSPRKSTRGKSAGGYQGG